MGTAVRGRAGARSVLDALRRKIRAIDGGFGDPALRRHVSTGIAPLDRLLPGGGLPAGAITEMVETCPAGGALTLALLAAREAARPTSPAGAGGIVVLLLPGAPPYPPALAALGLDLDRTFVLQPPPGRETLWALEEALRCPEVAAVIGRPDPRLARVPATGRRLVGAAEAGGGVGLLLAPGPCVGPAAVRLAVTPLPSSGSGGRPAIRRLAITAQRARGGPCAADAVQIDLDWRGAVLPPEDRATETHRRDLVPAPRPRAGVRRATA